MLAPNNNCSQCVLGQFCLPVGLSASDSDRIDELINVRTPLKKGDYLYRQGTELEFLYNLRYGALKSEFSVVSGNNQVIGFHLPGELLGVDGIAEHIYQSNAIALEDSVVCVVPFSELETLSHEIPNLQHHLNRVMSREIYQDHRHSHLLGTLNAEEKFACLLINFFERFQQRGHPSQTIDLPMSREDMASYLGIQIETLSRVISRFVERQLITIKQRHVEIIDLAKLKKVAENSV